MKYPTSKRPSGIAFTLTELLIVMAVIGLVLAIAIPSLEPMMKGSKLSTAADSVRYKLSAARQQAISENRSIELRFYKYVDKTLPGRQNMFRGFQIGRFALDRSGNKFEFRSMDKLEKLPDGIVFSSAKNLSSILNDKRIDNGTSNELPELGEIDYVSIVFRADGTTNLPKRSGDFWFLTMVQETDEIRSNTKPDNFISIMIDPFTGVVKSYQPGA